MSQPAPRPVWPSSTWHFMAGALGLASHRKGWLWPLRPPPVMASYAQHWMEWPPVISIAKVMAEADFPQMFRKQKLCLVESYCNNKCSFTTLDFFGGAAVIIVNLWKSTVHHCSPILNLMSCSDDAVIHSSMHRSQSRSSAHISLSEHYIMSLCPLQQFTHSEIGYNKNKSEVIGEF